MTDTDQDPPEWAMKEAATILFPDWLGVDLGVAAEAGAPPRNWNEVLSPIAVVIAAARARGRREALEAAAKRAQDDAQARIAAAIRALTDPGPAQEGSDVADTPARAAPVLIEWDADWLPPVGQREAIEVLVRKDIAASDLSDDAADVIFHHVFLNEDRWENGPYVLVYGKPGSVAFHCRYDPKPPI